MAFVGESGSGKSTLAKILIGLLKYEEGTVLLDEEPLKTLSLESLYEKVSYLSQDAPIFDGTIRENLIFDREVPEEDIRVSLEAAQLLPLLATLEQGLDTRVGEKGACLSGGEKQRLALARLMLDRSEIVVLDEADKILCESAVGSGGTDHHVLLQNDLLKMMDGDVIEFGVEDKQPALSVDCSKVSVIMLGAFEHLLAGKAQSAKHIGFGTAPKADAGGHKDISYDDLIHAGMRLEIAGRINKIIALEQLSVDGYKAILRGPVLSGLQESTGCKISIDSAAGDALAEQAIESGLGVRWMRSAILNAIDDAMFDDPEAKAWSVTLEDGRLRCRARKLRKSGRACINRDRMAELPF